MPTKKKRVGFIPRGDVMKIIEKFSIENNLSNSKIISILVEEALSVRGIFNKKTGKLNQTFLEMGDSSADFFNVSFDLENNDKFTVNNKLGNHMNNEKPKLLKQIKKDDFDLKTYKKFISFLKFQEMMNELGD